MNLLEYTGKKFNYAPVLIYCFAYQYSEVRVHPKQIGKDYVEYLDTGILPDVVSDYCLSLLSGNAVVPTPYFPQSKVKQLKEKND